MSYNYNRDGGLFSYFIMYQDTNGTETKPSYNASFADLVQLGLINNSNGYTFNGTLQDFCEQLTNGSNISTTNAENANLWTPTGFKTFGEILGNKNIFDNKNANTFWNGSNFSSIPIANANTDGGITSNTYIDWNNKLSGNIPTGNTNFVGWISDVSNVSNAARTVADTALINADAAMGVGTCANNSAAAALNAIGNVSNIPSPYTDIIGWVNGELGDISAQLSNIIGS